MKTYREIIEQSINLYVPNVSGVYFLIHKERIVYVGKSNDFFKRLKHHRSNLQMKFDRYSILECECEETMLEMETKYIRKLMPIYNIDNNPLAESDINLAKMMIMEEDLEDKNLSKTISWDIAKTILERNGITPRCKSVFLEYPKSVRFKNQSDE